MTSLWDMLGAPANTEAKHCPLNSPACLDTLDTSLSSLGRTFEDAPQGSAHGDASQQHASGGMVLVSPLAPFILCFIKKNPMITDDMSWPNCHERCFSLPQPPTKVSFFPKDSS